MALLIVSIVITIVMTIYSRSNKYAAKGTWRVHTIAKQRTALRQVKDLLEKSSYPSVIRVNNYYESSPDFGSEDYVMKLEGGRALSGTTGTAQYYAFDQAGDIVTFYACTPRQELEGVASALSVIPGRATKVVLSLEDMSSRSVTSVMRLYMTSATADVALSGDKPTVGSFGNEQRIDLLEDVSTVAIGVDGDAAQEEKTVLEFHVLNTDPFDGRLQVRETAKAQINVRVKPK